MKQNTHRVRIASPRRSRCSLASAVSPQRRPPAKDDDKKLAPQPPAISERIPPRPGRQAAHRGLQGHAALAVGADPSRRQDHAAARRRHRGDEPDADRAARHDRQGAEGIHHQPDGDGHRRRGAGLKGVRDGRGHASRHRCTLHGPTTILQALAMAGGFKEFANTKDVSVLRPDGHRTCRRCGSTTRTRSTATPSRSPAVGRHVIVP